MTATLAAVGRTRAPASSRRGRPGYDIESLLKVAVSVFNEKGFDGTSMEDLSRRLGISKSGIYHHVSSKDELLELALNRALDGLAEVVDNTRQMQASAIERLEYLVKGSVLVLVRRTPFVRLLLRVHGNTAVERRALARRREFDHFGADLVDQAAGDGAVLPRINPAITAKLLFGLVNSVSEWFTPQSKLDAERMADAIWQVAFSGIGQPA
ncbi:MAG: TetR/AcrR family transcriptional regulator [Streptosporangiaceae bacterium]|jgi:AcrR family transcriptional regulator